MKIFRIRKRNINKNWTEEEDNSLIDLVNNKYGKKWKIIHMFFPKRTKFECYNRYVQINPQIKKGKWSKEEDQKIKNLVEEYGYDWSKISNIVKTRTSKQIRSRYIFYLDSKLNNTEFSQEEDEMVQKLFPIFKTNWVKYINYLPNRSAKIIQNRYRSYK